MPLYVDAHSPFPVRRPVTKPLEPVTEGGGVPRNQVRPSIPELAGFLGINADAVGRAIEDLNRSGYRPLHPPGIIPLSSISVPIATRGAPGRDGEGGVIRGSPVEEAES